MRRLPRSGDAVGKTRSFRAPLRREATQTLISAPANRDEGPFPRVAGGGAFPSRPSRRHRPRLLRQWCRVHPGQASSRSACKRIARHVRACRPVMKRASSSLPASSASKRWEFPAQPNQCSAVASFSRGSFLRKVGAKLRQARLGRGGSKRSNDLACGHANGQWDVVQNFGQIDQQFRDCSL